MDWNEKFQSTHPVRGGTLHLPYPLEFFLISIHPPREGWDLGSSAILNADNNFNPPTP